MNILLITICLISYGPQQHQAALEKIFPSDPDAVHFFMALAQIESGFKTTVVGDRGRSVGIYQIQKAYVDDANYQARQIGFSMQFKYSDRTNPVKSTYIVLLYLDRYCTATRLGHSPTLCDAIRLHNGGPYGCEKFGTIVYWYRYRKIYQGY